AADGEIVAGRGFWPGLCVSLKHNSRFASFTIIAKGDFPAELNIPVPFSLISNDVAHDRLVVMPGYWFMYNMYALARNAWKYVDRDKRTERIQRIEYDFLAPDTINELFDSLSFLEKLKPGKEGSAEVTGWENSSRKTELHKIPQAIKIFKELVQYYGTMELLGHFRKNNFADFTAFKKTLSASVQRSAWLNIGGQLIQRTEAEQMKRDIRSGKIKSWDELHGFYRQQGIAYDADRLNHGYTSLLEILHITPKQFTPALFRQLLQQALDTKEWICKGIFDSRAKDYNSPFRKMVYDTNKEMEKVMGRLEDNSFIQQQLSELEEMKKQVKPLLKKLK
ncbi:MAG: DUF4954 family protein, partial [Ferruginibacter sp.]|nr:DUF4954 family protein [Ferruginibacter sp.]